MAVTKKYNGPILLGVSRMSRKHYWATLFLAGKTVSVDVGKITFYPCTSKPPQTEAFIREEKKENYTEVYADIYGTERAISALCVTLGIGTTETPIHIDSRLTDD